MEKYGVDEKIDIKKMEKIASNGCPKCGSPKVFKHGDILICPNCGSAPFESEDRK